MKRLGGVAAVVVAALLMAGCSGRMTTMPVEPEEAASAAVTTVTVPNVVEMRGDEARDALEAVGLEVDFDADEGFVIRASNWTVDTQAPVAGATSAVGDTVTLTVSKHDDKTTAAPSEPVAPQEPTDEGDQEPTNKAPADTTTGGVDQATALIACNREGAYQYPYGFDVHWFAGEIVYEIRDDLWFMKAEVTVTNQYGAELDTVMECVVGGTAGAPVVTSLFVY